MAKKPHSLIKASEINGMNEIEFHHPLNPALFSHDDLSVMMNVKRTKLLGVKLSRAEKCFVCESNGSCLQATTPTILFWLVLLLDNLV